jgi:hypothetical protein
LRVTSRGLGDVYKRQLVHLKEKKVVVYLKLK